MYPQDALHEDSNLTVKGVVISIEENYKAWGFGPNSYHIYRFYITINITEIVWAGGYLEDYFPESEGFSFADRTLNGWNSTVIGYDNLDTPNLQIGQTIECKGYYISVTDTPGSFKITVSPSINGSYLTITR